MGTIFLIIILIALDQITKYLATAYLEPVGTAPFIEGFMEFRYVLNDGAAFSMFSGNRWMLIGFTSVALVLVALYLIIKKPKLKLEKIALILILSGGIGNLIDRIIYGYVVDFFATTFINFAVFNVADCFVVIGSGLLIISVISEEINTSKEKTKAEKTDKTNEALDDNIAKDKSENDEDIEISQETDLNDDD